MSDRIRKAFDAAEHLPKAEADAQLRSIAAIMEPLGKEYMEPFAAAAGFNVEAMQPGGDETEGERYWERFGILGVFRPLLACRHEKCLERWPETGFPTICFQRHLMHMQNHGWTGKDAAAWLEELANQPPWERPQ